MAFGEQMKMMGGKANLHGSGKPKEEKPEEKGEHKPEGHDGGKHFHVHHDGLSYHAHGESDGNKEDSQEHGDMDSVKGHMDQFFGENQQDQQPQQPEQNHGFGGL